MADGTDAAGFDVKAAIPVFRDDAHRVFDLRQMPDRALLRGGEGHQQELHLRVAGRRDGFAVDQRFFKADAGHIAVFLEERQRRPHRGADGDIDAVGRACHPALPRVKSDKLFAVEEVHQLVVVLAKFRDGNLAAVLRQQSQQQREHHHGNDGESRADICPRPPRRFVLEREDAARLPRQHLALVAGVIALVEPVEVQGRDIQRVAVPPYTQKARRRRTVAEVAPVGVGDAETQEPFTRRRAEL